MGILTKSSGVVSRKTLGKILYMQISAAITENSLLFNIFKSMHDNVSKSVCMYTHVFMVKDYDKHHYKAIL